MKDIDADAVTAVSLDVDTAAMDKFDEDDVLRLTLFKRKRGCDWSIVNQRSAVSFVILLILI